MGAQARVDGMARNGNLTTIYDSGVITLMQGTNGAKGGNVIERE